MRPKQNGPAPREGQPVKSLTNHASYFIAACARIASAGGTFTPTVAAIALQTVLMRFGGILGFAVALLTTLERGLGAHP